MCVEESVAKVLMKEEELGTMELSQFELDSCTM